MDARLRKKGWTVVGAFVVALAYIVFAHHNPGGGFIGCPFRALTSFSCFGCGMTRSTGYFLHGDLIASFRHHPFGGAFVVGFAAAAGHYLVQNLKGRELDYGLLRLWRRVEKPAWVIALILLLGFGATRFVLELAGILTPI